MVDLDLDGRVAAGEGPALPGRELEADEVHRADAVLARVPRLELRGHPLAADHQVQTLALQPDQRVEVLPDALALGDLDEEGRPQLALAGDEVVVDAHLLG